MSASTEHRLGQLIPFADFVVSQRLETPQPSLPPTKPAAPRTPAPLASSSPPPSSAIAPTNSGFYELNDLHDALRRIEAALLNERAQNRKLQEELAQTIARHQHEKRILEDRAHEARRNEEEMKAGFGPLHTSEARLRQKLVEITTYSHEVYAALQTQQKAATEQFKRLRHELALAKSSYETEQERTQELERTLAGLREQAEKLRRDGADRQWRLQASLTSLQNEHRTIEAELHRLREVEAESRHLNGRIHLAELKNQELKEAQTALETENRKLKQALAHEKQTCENLQRELEAERSDKHALLASISSTEARITEAESRLALLSRNVTAAPKARPASSLADIPIKEVESLSQEEAEKLCEKYIIGLPGTII